MNAGRPGAICLQAQDFGGLLTDSQRKQSRRPRYPAQSHVLSFSPSARLRPPCQCRSGALIRREASDHAGCLHTGSELEQTCSTEQGCKNDCVKRRSEGDENTRKLGSSGLIGPLSDPDL